MRLPAVAWTRVEIFNEPRIHGANRKPAPDRGQPLAEQALRLALGPLSRHQPRSALTTFAVHRAINMGISAGGGAIGVGVELPEGDDRAPSDLPSAMPTGRPWRRIARPECPDPCRLPSAGRPQQNSILTEDIG